MLYAMGQSKISAEDVRQVVPATGEATNFGIANAIEQNDAAEALRELTLALDGGAQPFFLMGQLRWVAEKMPRARLKAAIDAVFRTDEAIKSSGGDPKVLLERLVVELCGSAKLALPHAGAAFRRSVVSASSRTASRTSRPR
jgi:DNA polymerase III delta subunit